MGGPFALRAEIFHRFHDSGAEIHLPEAVHGDAREQRIFGGDQPLREAQPVVRRAGRERRKGGRNAGLHSFARLVVCAADQQVRLLPDRVFRHDHHTGEGAIQLFAFQAERCQLFPGLANFLGRGVRQEIRT